jgi:hypothetical protein
MWRGCSIRYTSWNFSCSSYSSIRLGIWDLTASASYKLKVGWPDTHTELIRLHTPVERAVRALRARIARHVNITRKCKFLVNSQNLNWANKACFREELPLGSLGSEKFATSESSFTKSVVFWTPNCIEANLCREVFWILHCTEANSCVAIFWIPNCSDAKLYHRLFRAALSLTCVISINSVK